MDYSAKYAPPLLAAEHSIAVDLGVDVMAVGPELYRINLLTLSLIGMVMKVISDVAPAVTDTVWQQRLAIAVDTGPGGDRSGWPGWVLLQITPELLAQYGATTADSVASLQAKIAAYNGGQ